MPTARIYAGLAWHYDRYIGESVGTGFTEEYRSATRTAITGTTSKDEMLFVKFNMDSLNGRLVTSVVPSVEIRQYWDIAGYSFVLRARAIDVDWNNNSPSPIPIITSSYPSVPVSVGRKTFSSIPITDGKFYGIALAASGQVNETPPNVGLDISVSCYLSDGRATDSQRMYCDVTYTNPTPYPTNHNPASGFVNEHADNTFSWGISADNIIGTMTQGAAKFRWRPVGTTTYTEIDISGTTNRYTVPANTFLASSNIEWQVQVQSSDGVWSNSSEWFTLTTTDVLSNAMPVSPKNLYVQVDNDQVFTWEHVIDTGTEPTGADLQYQANGGAWTNLASITGTTATSVTIPGGTIPAGNILWRVRTYNSDGVAGNWSETAAIVGKGTPATPTITSITGAARPRISWQSLGQVSYQLQILQSGEIVYDTGEIAGTSKQYTITNYLEDKSYSVRLRIKNADLIWSAWATLSFTITTTKPTAPTVTVSLITNGVRIIAEPDETVSKMYLFRNGIPIAKITGVYNDYAALGATTYFVRAIGDNDSFIDTAPSTVTAAVPYATLAAVDDLQNPVNLIVRRDERPGYSGNRQIAGTAHHYAGRRLPVYTFSEFTDDTTSIIFSFRDSADFRRLDTLIERRRTILYRDRWGDRYYCVLTGIDHDRDIISTDFTLPITKVDFVEQIQYDVPEV